MSNKHGKVATLNMWLREFTSQIKTLCLYYHNIYGHKTYLGGDIPQRAPNHKFAWPLNEKVLLGYARKWIISPFAEDP